jgi:hypothetical protein
MLALIFRSTKCQLTINIRRTVNRRLARRYISPGQAGRNWSTEALLVAERRDERIIRVATVVGRCATDRGWKEARQRLGG